MALILIPQMSGSVLPTNVHRRVLEKCEPLSAREIKRGPEARISINREFLLGAGPSGSARSLSCRPLQLVAKFTKSAAITRSLLNQFFLVRASCSQFSAPFAFVEIVEAFVAIVVAMVAIARPFLDASRSNVTVLRKRCGRDGKECSGSYG